MTQPQVPAEDRQVRNVMREAAEGYHILRLFRPEKKNALNAQMYADLCAGLRAGEADDAIGVHVLLGHEGVFCAGHDIAEFAQAAGIGGVAPSGTDLADVGAAVIDFVSLLPRLNKPLIAGVDGVAVGVGVTLLFHCDLVFATPRAQFSTPFVDLGLVQEAGAGLLGPRLMGYPRALELLVAGHTKDVAWMHDVGLVNAVVSPEELVACVTAAAADLAAKPRSAMLAARALLRPDRDAVIAQVDREGAVFRERLMSAEAAQAFAAFFARDRSGERQS